MRFCWVTINVRDMEKSLTFYQDVIGLSINRRMNTMPGTAIVFLGSDNTTEVELIRNEKNNNPQYGNAISLGFEVTSLDETIAFLNEKSIPIHSGPFQPNPVVKFLYLLDPDGVKVQIVQNLKP